MCMLRVMKAAQLWVEFLTGVGVGLLQVLGPMPPKLIRRGQFRTRYFSDADTLLPRPVATDGDATGVVATQCSKAVPCLTRPILYYVSFAVCNTHHSLIRCHACPLPLSHMVCHR